MSRFGAVLVFCLAFCLSQAQDLTQSVDYTTRAKPLRLVLADLTKKTNVQLNCAQNIEEEPLILKLSGVPLKETMDRIASVFGGAWSKTNAGFELALGSQATKWHDQAIQRAADAVNKDVEDQLRMTAPDKPLDPSYANALAKTMFGNDGSNEAFSKVQRQFSRDVLKILQKIDPKTLFEFLPGQRVDYATDPTRFQRQLPESGTEIADLVANENMWSEALAANVPNNSLRDTYLRGYPHLTPPFGKIVFDIESESTPSCSLSLDIYDAEGKRLKRFAANVGQVFDFKTHRVAEQGVRKKMEAGVALGPAAEEIAPFELTQDRSGLRPISDATRNILLSPTRTDPLAVATSDLALGLGDQMNLNVVYLPTDWGEIWAYIASRGAKTNLEILQKVMERTNDTQLAADGKWLVGRPTDPIGACHARMPRKALESFLQSVSQAGYLDIDSIASFSLALGPSVDLTPLTFTLPPLGLKGFVPVYTVDDKATYAFYGSLSDQQKRSAKDGVLRLDKTILSAEQIDFLLAWILNGRQMLSPGGGPFVASGAIKDPIPDLQRLRSEALQDWLGNGAFVEVTDRAEPRFHVARSDVPSFDDPVSIESLADTVSVADRERSDSGPPLFDLNAIGTSAYRTVHVRLVLNNGYGDSYDLTEDHLSNKKQTLAALLKDLPAGLKRRYDAELAKVGKQNGGDNPAPSLGQPGAPPE